MTRRSISIPTLLVVTVFAISGCATVPPARESSQNTGHGWHTMLLFAASIAIYLYKARSGDDGAYVGTGTRSNDEDRPVYCADWIHEQLPECN